jgi:poly-gamma-glutamate synthesis protein (capsule biosynthesis protein)
VALLVLVVAFVVAGTVGAVAVSRGGETGALPRDRSTDASSGTSSSRPTSTTTTVPPTTTTNPLGSGRAVRIAFGGDTHFEGMLSDSLAADPAGLLAPVAPILSGADLAVVNLETAITERGEPAPKEFTFRAPASALTALASAGVDVASMANNHGLDYGPVGLEDSLAAEAATGFPMIGIGRNAAEAYAPHRAVIAGQRIAVIGATQVVDSNLISAWTATDTRAGLASAKEVDRLVAAVRDARATSDTVVVFLHWGIEGQTCPSAGQQELARVLTEAGADILVGGHAHRLQGAGRLGAAFVGYGLGNFVWYSRGGPGAETGVLVVTVTGRRIDGYEWHPARIRGGVPHPLDGDAAVAARAAWDGLRGCTGLGA